jgi:hypothetical protein
MPKAPICNAGVIYGPIIFLLNSRNICINREKEREREAEIVGGPTIIN